MIYDAAWKIAVDIQNEGGDVTSVAVHVRLKLPFEVSIYTLSSIMAHAWWATKIGYVDGPQGRPAVLYKIREA